jgi:hypothetical protein
LNSGGLPFERIKTLRGLFLFALGDDPRRQLDRNEILRFLRGDKTF